MALIANNEKQKWWRQRQQPFQTCRSLFISQKKKKEKRSLGLWVLFFLCGLPHLLPKPAPPHLSLAPWECEGWNDTQWLTVAQGSGFWPWLAGSVWQLVSPLPSFWPAASTVVVVGLIGATLWSLTLGLTRHCYLQTGGEEVGTKLSCPVKWLRAACERKKKKEAKNYSLNMDVSRERSTKFVSCGEMTETEWTERVC